MTAAKAIMLLLKNSKVRKGVVGIVVGVVMVVFLLSISGELMKYQHSTALASAAESEYEFWQHTTPSAEGLSCQGEKYCKHFNYGVVDWCALFVGYCIEEASYETKDFGFSPRVSVWEHNLKEKNQIAEPDNYSPQVGNLIFFDYSGRAHYKSGGKPGHIGIVVAVDGDTITVVAGNEYNGHTSNWAHVSCVNHYTRNINDNSIACYGVVGSDDSVIFDLALSGTTKLTKLTRNVISHNEIGAFYDKINPSEYGSVIANDNGALSIGVYGWHGNNALKLLQTAYMINSNEVTSVCKSYGAAGSYILSCITKNETWSRFIPNAKQCSCIKAIILTTSGKLSQERTSLTDVNNYIKICMDNGLSNNDTIVYCSDILNQWGVASFNQNVYAKGAPGVLYGINGKMSLRQIYESKAGWGSSGKYKNRRKWTYDYLKSLKEGD